jgi:transposase
VIRICARILRMNEIKSAASSARVSRPERFQVEMHFHSLDQLLPSDHRARLVWQYVQGLDLDPLYQPIKVSDQQAGRSAIDPQILVALWLLATLDGIGSARELARRCREEFGYMWICGGVGVNHHTLSDFRSGQADFLEHTLVDSVASLIERGLVPLEIIAQDGMRVRAHAGKSSFRRKAKLEQLQEVAQQHCDELRKQSEDESLRQTGDVRRQAAQRQAAEDRKKRIDEALKQHEKLAQSREKRKKGEGDKARVSTTDPDARTMKMANGGYDPAYNVQFATDADSRVIVGVEVSNEGTDGNQLDAMHRRVVSSYGKTPRKVLADAAFANKDSVTKVQSRGSEVVSTVPRREQLQRHGKDPHMRQKGDTDQYVAFRARMADPAYQELYKQRPSVAEFPNAECRNRNLRQFPVRGLVKVKAVALWHALAFNLMRMWNLEALAT